MSQLYVGSKVVKAIPMGRAEYNTYRKWDLPSNEDGSDEGYLVEYTDGGKPNDDRHGGYISWSPKAQFDNSYIAIQGNYKEPHKQRISAELSQLSDRVGKLRTFIGSDVYKTLTKDSQILLFDQLAAMTDYENILILRLSLE